MGPSTSLANSFPPALLEGALAVWKGSVRQTGRMSKLHEQVSQALWSLGIPHTNDHITPDGLFCVDIALQDIKVSYCIPLWLGSTFADMFMHRNELCPHSGSLASFELTLHKVCLLECVTLCLIAWLQQHCWNDRLRHVEARLC